MLKGGQADRVGITQHAAGAGAVLKNEVNEIAVCVDLGRRTGVFYTMISITEPRVRLGVAALLAQGLDPFEASVLGAELHARAGLAAAARWSTIAATAEDVVACIPDAIAELASASS